jgi:hypothetical protein
MPNNQQNGLQTVFTYPFLGDNALRLSLMKRIANQQPNYFCFLTVMPGQQNNDPTYNQSENEDDQITLKCEAHRILALGHALYHYATGNGSTISNFYIVSYPYRSDINDSTNNEETGLTIECTTNNNGKYISLLFTSGQNNPLAFIMNVAEASALSYICKFVAHKCLELMYIIQSNRQISFTVSNQNTVPAQTNKDINEINEIDSLLDSLTADI